MEITPNKPGGLLDAAVTGSKGKSTADLASFGNVAVSFTNMVQKAGSKMLRQGSSPEIEQANADGGGRASIYDEPQAEAPEAPENEVDLDDNHRQEQPAEHNEAPVATLPNEAPEQAPVYDTAEAPQETANTNNDGQPQNTGDDGTNDNADMTSDGDDAPVAEETNNGEVAATDNKPQTGADVVADLGPVLTTAAAASAQTSGQATRVAPVEKVIEQLSQAKNPTAVVTEAKTANTKTAGGNEANQQNQNAANTNADDNAAFLDGLLGKKDGKQASTKANQQGQQASAAKAENANANANANAHLRTDPLNPAQTQAQQLAKTLNDPKANVQINVTVNDEAQTLTSKPTASLTPTAVATKAEKPATGQNQNQNAQNNNAAGTPQAGIAAQGAQPAQVLAQLAQGGNPQAASNGQAAAAATTAAGSGAEGVNATSAVSPAGNTQPGQTLQQATQAQKPATPQQAAHQREVMQQVTVQITKAMNAGADKINIQLRPASLGRVEVQLEMAEGRITATVVADSKETLDLLKSGAKDLAKSLNSAGLQTDSNDLEFSLREQGNQNVARDGKGKDDRLDFDDVANGEGEEDPGAALETALRDIISEGRVDVRA